MSHGTAWFVKTVRQSYGLNQAEFGLLLNVTSGCVSRWERGLSRPRPWCHYRIELIYQLGIRRSASSFGRILQLLLVTEGREAAAQCLDREIRKYTRLPVAIAS